MKHTKETLFKCELCAFTTYVRSNLMRHKRVHSDEKEFLCEICRTGFNSKRQLEFHFAKHEELKPKCTFYKCKYCDYKSVVLGSVKDHENYKHTKKVKHFCSECDYWTTTKSVLRCHMYTHGVEKPLKCPQCEYRAIRPNVLETHLKNKHK